MEEAKAQKKKNTSTSHSKYPTPPYQNGSIQRSQEMSGQSALEGVAAVKAAIDKLETNQQTKPFGKSSGAETNQQVKKSGQLQESSKAR